MSEPLLDEITIEEEQQKLQKRRDAAKQSSSTSSPPNNSNGNNAKPSGGYTVPEAFKSGKMDGICAHCGIEMRNSLGVKTDDGPVHNDCVPAYKRLRVERCGHCDCVLPPGKRSIVSGVKLHPECAADFKAKKPYVPPTRSGEMRKFACGRSFLFGAKNWQTRFFFLSKERGLAYWANRADFDAGKSPKNKVVFETLRTRLIKHPTRSINPEATNPSKHFIIVFFESPSSKKELHLLCECNTWEEHDAWTNVLETYIKIVDDPKDVKDI